MLLRCARGPISPRPDHRATLLPPPLEQVGELQDVLHRLQYDKSQELTYEQVAEGLQWLGEWVGGGWMVGWAVHWVREWVMDGRVGGCTGWAGEVHIAVRAVWAASTCTRPTCVRYR